MRTALKIVLATAAFAAVHSALASHAAKRAAANVLGERRQRALYRPFFVAQALLTTAALARYGSRLPKRTIYRLHGPAAWLCRAGQAAALLQVWAGAREVGVMRLTGLDGLAAWRRGGEPPEPPAAQGPELDPASGRLTDGGPFRLSRHPLNFAGVPLFWLTPHLTTRRLAFNLASTVYFLAGSAHEAARLRAAYGTRYRAYEAGGVPFFFPRLRVAQPDRPPLPPARSAAGLTAP
ncbi:methyltransferase family protein [Caldimonas tepidiphila]|uniref:methyltransferase family protein n=1 Tax=Caldimonas tepidiphila TaxID=2315841 RepID=UPI000E5BC831|nr:hypothetical protein [Caldimonas tepidiphila]